MLNYEIKKINSSDEKAKICINILNDLEEWFGIEAYTKKYTEESKSMPFLAVYLNDKAVGFVSIKVHNIYTAEIYVMGVLRKYQHQGLGKKLLKQCELFCKNKSIEYLTVKTLDESSKSYEYEKTRRFYLSAGFRPLEVFPLLWDKNNPCLFMAKCLK